MVTLKPSITIWKVDRKLQDKTVKLNELNQQLDEGWKQRVGAAALAGASMFGGAAGLKAQSCDLEQGICHVQQPKTKAEFKQKKLDPLLAQLKRYKPGSEIYNYHKDLYQQLVAEYKQLKERISEDIHDTTINIRGRQVDVSVEYTPVAGSRGRRDSMGAPEEPDEDAYVEIDAVYIVRGGKKKDITKFVDEKEMEKLQFEIMSSSPDEPDFDDYDEPDDDDYDRYMP